VRPTATIAASVLIVVILFLGSSGGNAQMTYIFRADSTMDGSAGTIFRITESGSPGQDVFIIEEDDKYRVFALREDGAEWFNLIPAQYFSPISSMTIGETWRFVNDNGTDETRATVVLQEEITTNAGSFLCYRIDIENLLEPGTVSQSMWLSDGAGMIREKYFEASGYWFNDLDNYFAAGTGFMPRVVGNWWSYAGQLVGTEESSWGKIKKELR
jgi:hypothetical protein